MLHDLGRSDTLDLNKPGDVGGTRVTDDGRSLPFLWRDGRFTDLAAALGARYGAAYSINELGEIVGAADGRTFVHDGTRGRYLDIPGATTSAGNDINDQGLIVGSATFADSAITGRAFVFRDGQAALLPQPLPFKSGGYGAHLRRCSRFGPCCCLTALSPLRCFHRRAGRACGRPGHRGAAGTWDGVRARAR
jgi:hypothetical protein